MRRSRTEGTLITRLPGDLVGSLSGSCGPEQSITVSAQVWSAATHVLIPHQLLPLVPPLVEVSDKQIEVSNLGNCYSEQHS